jgi:hypothetical protein
VLSRKALFINLSNFAPSVSYNYMIIAQVLSYLASTLIFMLIPTNLLYLICYLCPSVSRHRTSPSRMKYHNLDVKLNRDKED